KRSRLLETKLDAAKAAEQQLRDQVQTLEAEANRSQQLSRIRNARFRTKPTAAYDFGGASEHVPPFNIGERTRLGACSKFDDCYDCVYCKNEGGARGYTPTGYLGYA
ncbi:hypothetical protein FS749_016625, partial [Ceratobasidium sp. UAMH 11750]